jgi:hypothetical protein
MVHEGGDPVGFLAGSRGDFDDGVLGFVLGEPEISER